MMGILCRLCVCNCFCVSFFFFVKQKTAYEMRISDWSSDVCSSDLPEVSVDVLVDALGPRRALLQQLSDAQMVIVGSRGRAPLTATVLGSTSLNIDRKSVV